VGKQNMNTNLKDSTIWFFDIRWKTNNWHIF